MNNQQLLLCARLTRWIYGETDETSAEWVPYMDGMLKEHYGDDLLDFKSIERGHTRCAVVTWETQRVVVFCGSNDDEDWLANLDVDKDSLLRPRHPGKYHRGFLNAYLGVRGELKDFYNSLTPLIFTGHSLGGALATVAASDSGRSALVYTFGQPRTGDKAFAEHYNANIGSHTRVVNNNDIVTRVPSSWRFKHVGAELYIDRKKQLRPDIGTWGKFADRVGGRWDSALRFFGDPTWKRTDGIRDHDMAIYLDIIERYVKQGE